MKAKTRRIKRQRGGITFSNTVPVRMYNKTARAVMNANNANNANSVSATVGSPENNAPPYMNIGTKALKPEAAEKYGPAAKNEAAILAKMKQRMPYPYAAENAHAAAEYAYYSNNSAKANSELAKTLGLRQLNPLEKAEYHELMNKKVATQGFRRTIQETAASNILPKSSKNAIVAYLRGSKAIRNSEKMTY
jgi:hypothetical protein